MSSQVITADNAEVVIQINPQVAQDSAEEQDKGGTYPNLAIRVFLKVQPKSLGIVQIMIGVVTFLVGIVLTMTIHYFRIIVITGITYWGSLIYITAGSLSVAAENKLNPRLVKASHGINVASAVTAGIAIILTSVQLYAIRFNRLEVLRGGIVAILLVFSILQFIISICISTFADKITNDRNPVGMKNSIAMLRILHAMIN
nr:membrane-spanning 4-domains subfamily A member 12-like [Misgurnus anguillicaudatus]